MKRIIIFSLIAILMITSGITIPASASSGYSVSIDEDNRIIVSGDAADYVCFAAQYDKDMKLISIDYSYLYSFMPDVDEDTAYLKAFVWDSMDSMNNLAAPITKELDFAEHLSVKFSDIREVTVGSARTIINYWTYKDNNKTNTIRINKDAVYTINGETKSSYNNNLLAAFVSQGCLTYSAYDAQIDFHCTTASDAYDYDSVEITVYEDFLVDSYDEISCRLYAHRDSPSNLASIDMYSADYITTIKDVYGNTVSASQLQKCDVLSLSIAPYDWGVMASEIQNIEAVLSRNTLTGTVTEVNYSDDEVYINGKPYVINHMSAYYPILDDDGTFYLDFNGEIVAYDRTSSKNNNYAVIINAAQTAGVDIRYQVKMYTSDGSLEVRDLADKVKMPVYKGSYTTTSSYDDNEAFNNIPAFPAVCSYKLNAAGEISSLSFAAVSDQIAAESSALVMNNRAQKGEFEVEGKEIKRVDAGSTFYIDEDTKIIAMNASVDPSRATINDLIVYTAEDFTVDQAFDSIAVYDVDVSNYAGFIFIYDDSIVNEHVGDEVVTESGYGIILNAAQTSGIDEVYQVKMYTDKGKMVAYDLASKVQRPWYDGASTSEEYYTDDVIYNRLLTLPVICKYKLNDRKQICSITYENSSCYDYVESDALITNELKETGSVTGGEAPVIKTDKTYNLTKDTKIIVMDPSVQPTLASVEDLSAYSYDEFPAEETDIASVSIYDTDEEGNAGFVFICDDSFFKEYEEPETIIGGGYGIIINKAATAAIEEIYQVKMYTDKGAIEVRELADKLKMPVYDGTTTVTTSYDSDDAYAKIPAAPAVCSYKINSAGEICSLSFSNGEYKATTAAANSEALVMNNSAERGEVEAKGQEIKRVDAGSTFYMDEDTKIIAMESGFSPSTAQLNNFALYTVDDFTVDQAFDSIAVYDVDANNYASLIFIYDTDIALASNEIDVVMVKSVTDVNNADGDPTMKVYGYNKDGSVSMIFDDESSYMLDVGEVFFPKSYNSDGEVKKIVQATQNNNGAFELTRDFLVAYKAMLAEDFDSTFYFGKVDYKQKNTVYFTNLLAEQGGSFVAKADESLIIPNATSVMVYDASRASSNKVSYESAGYMSYGTKVDENGQYPISSKDIGSYYILVREHNGQITDVVYYCYTTDVVVSMPQMF